MLLQFREKGLVWLCLLLWLVQGSAQARTVTDAGDGLTIEGQPQRVVVLEYSFLDAVVLAGVSPIGIADDGKPHRILSGIQQQLSEYTSVGLRGQPNLESIASLKPDLIIADKWRHQAIYEELRKIAPTLLLLSYGACYEDLLRDAELIGEALGRREQMQKQLTAHQQRMDSYAQQLAGQERLLFAVVSKRGMTVHGVDAFASGVMQRLGLQTAIPAVDTRAYLRVSFEQLAAMNPDWLFIGDYSAAQGGADILKRWQQHPLWPMLTVARKQQLVNVQPGVWSLGRGIYAAEQIATDLLTTSLAER